MDQEQLWKMTGREYYDYDVLCDLDEAELGSYCSSVRKQFTSMAKAWSDEKNTEWVARHYLALKYILAAQLKASAAAYAAQQNLQIVVPYLHYYVLFHSCRAFLLTRPHEPVDISKASHGKIINCTVNAIGTISGAMKADLENLLSRSQAIRELFSYRFPATGLSITKNRPTSEETFLWARRLAELAEMNSECLATAVEKHCAGSTYIVDWDYLVEFCGYKTPEHQLDRDDRNRLGYLSHQRLPYELVFIAKAGLIEDFFGAWIADEELGLPDHAFDPDQGYGPSLFSFN
jgi:hypothetical protein